MNRKQIHHNYSLALCVLGIILLSVFGRRLQKGVSAIVDGQWIAWGIFLLLLIILGVFYKERKRKEVSVIVLCGAFIVLFGGGLAVFSGYLQPVETMHFLIFSWFGYLVSSVFGLVRGILVVICMAVGDEILQFCLPYRVGDLHDVFINALSGLTGLLLRWRP